MKSSAMKKAALKAKLRKRLPRYTIISARGRAPNGNAALCFSVTVEQEN